MRFIRRHCACSKVFLRPKPRACAGGQPAHHAPATRQRPHSISDEQTHTLPRAVGVCDYFEADLERVLAAGLPLPAVNQVLPPRKAFDGSGRESF